MEKPFETMSVCSLCSKDCDQLIIKCFQQAKPLSDIATTFYTCTQTYPSNLFQHYWSQQVEKIKHSHLTISDATNKLWQPVFDTCCTLLENIRSKKVVLSEVDRLLMQYRPEELHMQLQQLDKAMCKCLSKSVSSSQIWIKEAVERMEQYRSLRQHASAAKTFLKLRDTLKLTGDFGMIEKLSTEVLLHMHIFTQ